MALIQISDPDSSPSIKKQFSVGIDLGTSNSLIAESINKQVTFFKNNKSESKKLLNEIIDNEKSNENIKLEAQKKLIRDFSD